MTPTEYGIGMFDTLLHVAEDEHPPHENTRALICTVIEVLARRVTDVRPAFPVHTGCSVQNAA